MDFMLGCNYWDSKHGTDMWKYFDAKLIESDVKALSENGIKFMRVFPNWRDFQPVYKLREWAGNFKCYVDDKEQLIDDYNGIKEEQLENFRTFANICDKYSIKLCVAVVTGWMSGRQFVPPALEDKNPITNPEAMMWMRRFINGFVNGVKDCKNIVMWDLGNECNCLGTVNSRYEAYVWTALVSDAIRSADPTRPISSGMHGLSADPFGWNLLDQGELTDYICTHPYVSPSLNNDIDVINNMRATIYPTAQSILYSDVSKRPCIVQEQGTFSDVLGNEEFAADFVRINIFSALAHDMPGYFWWCGMNHVDLPNPPYTWCMMERDLGMLNCDNTPKPVGKEIKKAQDFIATLPFKNLEKRETDGVIMLTDSIDKVKIGLSAYTLCKQAGLDMSFAVSNEPLPDSRLYIIPCVMGWSVMHQRTWWGMRDKVEKEGASMLISFNGGQLSEFEETTGLRSNGIIKSKKYHTAKFSFGDVTYHETKEIRLESIGAEVLARNEEGNIVLSRNKFGKGYVYFLNMPLEASLLDQADAYNNTLFHKIYGLVGKEVLDDKVLTSSNPQICTALHKDGDRYIAFALNYSDTEQKCDFNLKDGYKLSCIKGNADSIGKCDCAIYYIDKE